MYTNFPKGKREENNIFLRKSSLSTTENFQLRVSFSRSILRTRDPAYQTSSSLHSSRTKDSLSLSRFRGGRDTRGYLQGVFSRLAGNRKHLASFVDGFPRILSPNLPQPTFVRTDITLPSTSFRLQHRFSLPPSSSLITIKNVVHRVEERLSTSLTGLYNRFRNIIIRADVDEINFTSAPRARI